MTDGVVHWALHRAKELGDALNRVRGVACSIELDAVTATFSYSPSGGGGDG